MTDHEMRIRLAEAMGWRQIRTCKVPDQVWGIDPDGNAGTLPNPLESDADAAALEVWCVTTRPWCAGLTIIVDPAWVEVCVDTYEGDPDAESVVVHRDTEPDPRRRRRSALCWAICRALDDPEAGGGA